MERAEAQQVGSVPVQLDVPRLGEPLDRYLPLQPLDLASGILAISRRLPPKNLSRTF